MACKRQILIVDFFFPLCRSHFDYPSAHGIEKIAGSGDENRYILKGFSIFRKLELVMQRYGIDNINALERVLDWGVGSARVLRHFLDQGYRNIEGADVDSDNLDWCKRTFASTNFHLLPLFPPSELKNDTYDLIFGISIFTHLNETAQIKWLEELSRILKPNGIVLVSVHGDMAMARSNPSDKLLSSYLLNGFVFSSHDLHGKELVGIDDYYGTTYTSTKYIFHIWNKYFDVLEVVPSLIDNFQDLVIMKKKHR
jgi:SAM-dependent methyltransferase